MLRDYMFYFQFTVTGYGKDIEPNIPDKKKAILPAFIELSKQLGKERVIWRYDPVFFNSRYTAEYHLRAFSQIAKTLEGYTNTCVISFLDTYPKVFGKDKNNIPVEEKTDGYLKGFSGKLAEIGKQHGMKLATCAEHINLSSVGIEHNACIDKSRIEKLLGATLSPLGKDFSQRPECLCCNSIDIGTYNTCRNGCRYCYANLRGAKTVERISGKYDPASPILCDTIHKHDEVVENQNIRSLIRRETQLFEE